jgi:hypothetical protein
MSGARRKDLQGGCLSDFGDGQRDKADVPPGGDGESGIEKLRLRNAGISRVQQETPAGGTFQASPGQGRARSGLNLGQPFFDFDTLAIKASGFLRNRAEFDHFEQVFFGCLLIIMGHDQFPFLGYCRQSNGR